VPKVLREIAFFVAGAVSLYGAWIVAVILLRPPEFLLPHPVAVWRRFFDLSNEIIAHTLTTATEFGLGFSIGLVCAIMFSVLTISSRHLEAIISPFTVILQSVPKIGLAPLFVVWFGYGLGPKIVISALISFFPIYVNLVGGMKMVEKSFVEYAESLRLSRWETIYRIRLPYALPYFLASLRMAGIYSVVGAVVGEFVGADKGLGYLILQGDLSFDTPLLFAALHVLIIIGILIHIGISILEAVSLRWRGTTGDVGFFATA